MPPVLFIKYGPGEEATRGELRNRFKRERAAFKWPSDTPATRRGFAGTPSRAPSVPFVCWRHDPAVCRARDWSKGAFPNNGKVMVGEKKYITEKLNNINTNFFCSRMNWSDQWTQCAYLKTLLFNTF